MTSLQTSLFGDAAPTSRPRRKPQGRIFDYFAGCGGASCGIRAALGRSPDVAINHDAHAIEIHTLNHPDTDHVRVDVWDVDPHRHLPPGDVDLFWASPDCRHFSRAKGGTPVSRRVRGLAWIVLRVAGNRLPKVIVLENVAEFKTWGPVRKGRPVKSKAGTTFVKFVGQLRALGYVVEDRVLDAADHGAPTHRRRLFLIARRDGLPVVWPTPTHGPGREHPYRTAAECIDWSLPVPSIFGRKRPLADATMKRIAEGLKRYVLTNPRPFVVQVNHGRDVNRSRSVDEAMPTITSHHGFALVAPTLVQTGYGERDGQTPRALDLHKPLGTIMATGQKHALVAAFLAKNYGGGPNGHPTPGQPIDAPVGTITAVDHHSLIACSLLKFYGTSTGAPLDAPAPTVTGQGNHAALVAAFITKYYSSSGGKAQAVSAQAADEPLATIVTKARFGLVTVEVDGESYALVDIGLRMLSPEELARCQGFGPEFKLTGTQAERTARVGNSVCPPLAQAIVAANLGRPASRRKAAA